MKKASLLTSAALGVIFSGASGCVTGMDPFSIIYNESAGGHYGRRTPITNMPMECRVQSTRGGRQYGNAYEYDPGVVREDCRSIDPRSMPNPVQQFRDEVYDTRRTVDELHRLKDSIRYFRY